MIIENLTTLKINQLTQAQYKEALAAGTVNENELYMTEEENADLTNFANHTLITIPAGRMRGDIDGDGKFTINTSDNYDTSTDFGLLYSHIKDVQILIDETQLLCADVNGNGSVNLTDSNALRNLINGTNKAGAFTEVTGNWTNNPNYATEDGQFYTDIPITGMTASHSASVIVKGTYESGFFTKAECVEGAIRIYAKLCPIEALSAVVSWGSGNGTAVITTESEDLTAYALKPTITTATLLASNWDSTAKTYSFESTYPSASYDIEVDIDGDNCTDAQLEAWIASKPLSSSTNKIIAKGDVPSVDIPIILTATPK